MMTSDNSNPEYDDIVRYKPEPLQFISDDYANSLLWDLGYNPIIRILRKGPMTLREIEAEYNAIAKTDENVDKKSDTTIYRYVKAFEKAGVVAQAGRRVYHGKTTTEILYCRAADVFLNRNLPRSYWKSERGRRFFERVYAGLGKIYDGHTPDKECLDSFIPRFEKAKDDQIEAVLEKIEEEDLQTITGGDMWEIAETFALVRIFSLLLNQPGIMDELAKCFKKTTA